MIYSYCSSKSNRLFFFLLGEFFQLDKVFIGFAPGSTVVDHSAHNPKVEGSNPAPSTLREKIANFYNPVFIKAPRLIAE